jgi:hypothetical protein
LAQLFLSGDVALDASRDLRFERLTKMFGDTRPQLFGGVFRFLLACGGSRRARQLV